MPNKTGYSISDAEWLNWLRRHWQPNEPTFRLWLGGSVRAGEILGRLIAQPDVTELLRRAWAHVPCTSDLYQEIASALEAEPTA